MKKLALIVFIGVAALALAWTITNLGVSDESTTEVTTVSVPLARWQDNAPSPDCSPITGTVEWGGKPIVGALIAVGPATADASGGRTPLEPGRTDEYGVFGVGCVNPGEHTLQVRWTSGDSDPAAEFTEFKVVRAITVEPKTPLEMPIQLPGESLSVEGRIVVNDGDAHESALLFSLENKSTGLRIMGNVTPSRDGRFSLTDLCEGELILHARIRVDSEFLTSIDSVALDSSMTHKIDVNIADASTVNGVLSNLPNGTRGDVTVYWGEVTETNALDALDMLARVAATVPVDTSGAFRVTGLMPDTYTFAAHAVNTQLPPEQAMHEAPVVSTTVSLTAGVQAVEIAFPNAN